MDLCISNHLGRFAFRCFSSTATTHVHRVRFFSQRRHLSGLRSFDNVRTLSVPIAGKMPKYCSAAEAVQMIGSGESIYFHHACSTPFDLIQALCDYIVRENLQDIRLSHGLVLGKKAPWVDLAAQGKTKSICLFIDPSFRKLVNQGKADYVPIFLSEGGRVYDEKLYPVDTALLNVSPPDKHGYCSLGVSVDMSSAAARNAKKIIASVNPTQPRTFGDSEIHISQIDALVNTETPIFELPMFESSAEEKQIAKQIAENLVEDEATLQMGIGSIPNSVLTQLINHKNIGIHSEMISDGILGLIEANVLTNNKKTLFPGKIITSFAMGSRKFYDFLDDNPLCLFASAGYTNSIPVIIQNHKMTAINAAIEVDLTGQVVSDSIGKMSYSGFGGQVDFIFGASIANDGRGKSIIALPSRTSTNEPKIVPFLKEGAGVVTTRAHCRHVVTEHGIAYLWGKGVIQRAYELIKIAHPDDRETLEKAAFKRFGVVPRKD